MDFTSAKPPVGGDKGRSPLVNRHHDYRFYCLTSTGTIGSGAYIEAVDDEAAIEMVKRRHPDSDCELWVGNRLVATIKQSERTA